VTVLALPTRRSEDWRYSDLEAVVSAWPVPAPERIVVAAGETARGALLQDAADGAVAVRDYVIEVGAGAEYHFHLLNIGGRLGRVTFDVRLGAGANFALDGAIIGGGEQTLEIVSTVTHAEPDAVSRQTIRAIMGGKATGNYLGKIAVARDAQRTDAGQSVKAMLLDRTATVNAKPELEIFADDVKCAHGASVGQLDAQALFYLAARGLAPDRARALLLEAFIAGLFDEMADKDVQARFAAAAQARLEAMT
jgi:Fe-S cluster assembly protein SufD